MDQATVSEPLDTQVLREHRESVRGDATPRHSERTARLEPPRLRRVLRGVDDELRVTRRSGSDRPWCDGIDVDANRSARVGDDDAAVGYRLRGFGGSCS